MASTWTFKNGQDEEFSITHPDNAGAITLNSNNIAKTDVVNAALALKANTADLKEIGVGQTWQDVTASRTAGVTYTNSTGKPIEVAIRATKSIAAAFSVYINGVMIATIQGDGSNVGVTDGTFTIIVPNGNTYSVVLASSTITKWFELR